MWTWFFFHYMVKNEFQIYILVRYELAHSPTCFFFFCICIQKKFWDTLVISDRNDRSHNYSLGTALSYIPEFSGLVFFVEQTLPYQTLYLEFYSISKWLIYRDPPFYHWVGTRTPNRPLSLPACLPVTGRPGQLLQQARQARWKWQAAWPVCFLFSIKIYPINRQFLGLKIRVEHKCHYISNNYVVLWFIEITTILYLSDVFEMLWNKNQIFFINYIIMWIFIFFDMENVL